ncbi:lipopolysaccharide biosynthesis protein [Halomonas sp. SpR8]|uniref:lipopolysaccharide biosynthesis protein n=1 Tax=Halomonas sp. SpR8 TaxID=3050463 RepID=UPI0027E5B5F3|nr:lipopolysaccharide biosynthesis protein [Halomonas sp. SpR8]MDQ7727261.1 lipopolysaccharide biosynthesis protein [Halomonas sp. SpR8]
MKDVNNDQGEASLSSTENISLVEFVVLLLKQWKVMLLTIVLVLGATAAILFLKADKYDYTTMYSIASFETSEGLKRGVETPQEVIAKIENIFLEQERRAILAESESASLPFEMDISNPENTILLRITSVADNSYQPLIEKFHEGLIETLKEDQANLVESLRNSLQQQYEAYSEALAVAQESNSEGASELVASYFEKVFLLGRRLESVNEGESSQTAVRSLEPVGINNSFILAIGLVLSFVLAPVVAMFSIFAKKVVGTYRKSNQ